MLSRDRSFLYLFRYWKEIELWWYHILLDSWIDTAHKWCTYHFDRIEIGFERGWGGDWEIERERRGIGEHGRRMWDGKESECFEIFWMLCTQIRRCKFFVWGSGETNTNCLCTRIRREKNVFDDVNTITTQYILLVIRSIKAETVNMQDISGYIHFLYPHPSHFSIAFVLRKKETNNTRKKK